MGQRTTLPLLRRIIPIALVAIALTCASATAQPMVTGVPATVNPGAPISFTVSGGPGNRTDWVGLYLTSSADTAYLAWQYLNGLMTVPMAGLNGATLQFTAPPAGGTYEVRFFSNNGFTRLAVSTSSVTVPGPTVTPAAATVSPGASINFTVANGPANRGDWVGLYETSAADGAYIAWQYLNGLMTLPMTGVPGATLHFTAPLTGGTYNVRVFSDNMFIRLATSSSVNVPAATVTPAAATVSPGASLNFTVAGGPGDATDWVGLYPASAADTGYIAWQYLNGLMTIPAGGVSGAALHFTAPVTPGAYNVRLFSNNGFLRLATSSAVHVLGPTVTLAAATVNPGAAINFTVASGPGNATDWVGLYETPAPDSAFLKWQYLNGLMTVPVAGVAGATLQFAAPASSVTRMYEVRFFSDNGFTRLATSSSSVSVPALSIAGVNYVSGLTLPVGFVQDPSDPTVQFVIQQTGRIRVIKSGVLQGTDFIDLSALISCCGERGLLGLAFPSDTATSRRFYVNFTNPDGHTVVARLRRSASNPLVADTSGQLNLRWGGVGGTRYIEQPFPNHNGGHIVFGPDGYLYVGMGDGGAGNDPFNNAQNPATLLGKMLRIDVNVADLDAEGYVVPGDNPFVAAPPTLPEIWDFGLRNPWKFSFDDGPGGTNGLMIGDVGQAAWEEVDFEPASHGGRNYGWVHREGAHPSGVMVAPTPGAPATLTDPVIEYDHSVGNAITGGFVYRGAALGPAFTGRYFFADYGQGRVWSALLGVGPGGELTASNMIEHTAALGGAVNIGYISAFGRDAAGELYLVQYGVPGSILKLVAGP
jgi:glucose/arabinose dehydrogenase